MMKPYQGSRHTAVAVSLRNGTSQVVGSGPNQPDTQWEDLIFEIGSITKVFTGILLCVLVDEGKIDPRAPLSEVSDNLSDVPDWITPERLVSHTSGLPNIYVPIWRALFQQRPEGPYARFSREDLLTWLQDWRGNERAAGRCHSYSNLGFGLLGEAMALREATPFADLLARKVIRPLGMQDTSGHLQADQQVRFMQPRNTSGAPVMPWAFDALAGAGYLRSTVGDLACLSSRVIQAINAPETALDRAIKRSAVPIFGLGRGGGTQTLAQCSGWMRVKRNETSPGILFANGGTAGSTCALYICPENEGAIAITSNNGIATNLWSSAKLSWSNPLRQAQRILSES
ncbi:Beta-lactamase class C [Candidatus Rhodobacter oscarellae]|uniref:Beta-lactamase class C n=1 Tax=Candidatus Rhodobacter oscarellae TaxID=1675527 RepID=A0A0J9EAM9_9RHOB|nr:serine hydrolase domain-containing protein [Candidatus Rhodobacter lobularis]KMW59666.1 Beta-lactamase class C [Candidatus Rhodobacter lobularis]